MPSTSLEPTNAQTAFVSRFATEESALQDGSAFFPRSITGPVGTELQFHVTIEGGGTLASPSSSAPPRPSSSAQASVRTGGLLTVDASASDSSVAISRTSPAALPIMSAGEKNTWVFDVTPSENGDFTINLAFAVLRQDSQTPLWNSNPEEVPSIDLRVTNTFNHGLQTATTKIGIYAAFLAAIAGLLAALIPSWREWTGRLLKRLRAKVTRQPPPTPRSRRVRG